MFLKKTVWIIIFIFFHTVFLMQTAYSDKQNFPTYSKFLEKFIIDLSEIYGQLENKYFLGVEK